MPLVFPPAPTAYFKRAKETKIENKKEEGLQPGQRFFPLNEGRAEKRRGSVPVEPLTRPLHRILPMQKLPPATKIPPQLPQGLPQMPQIPQMPQSLPQMHQPEKAAEQFRRVNNGLPDGVRYEPLDEETMRILRQKKQDTAMPSPQASSQASSQSAPQPALQATPQPASQPEFQKNTSSDIIETLKNLAQDERNAHIFYGNFANTKNKPFAALAKDSKARLEQITAVLEKNFNVFFVPSEASINTDIGIPEAIALAISEENKGLITLGNLLELAADTPAEKPLWRILNKKIIGHQLLLSAK